MRTAVARMRERFGGFVRSRRGNFATLTALTMPLLFMFAAFAVDEGSLFLQRRALQSLADLAAIQATSNLDGARAVAASLLVANGLAVQSDETGTPEAHGGAEDSGLARLTVTTGAYAADPAVDSADRFVAGAESPNAARVAITALGARYFAGQFMAPPTISVAATAATMPQAAFSIGSRLARLDAGILNALLGALAGSAVSLSLMDYQALASADVDLLDMVDALKSEADVTAVTYSELLDSRIGVGQLAAAIRRSRGLGLRADSAVERLGRPFGRSSSFNLSNLLDLGNFDRLPVGTHRPDLEPKASALDLLATAALLAVADGEHQVDLGLDGSATGLAGASLTLTVGEPVQGSPPFRVGGPRATARTAQLRLVLRLTIGGGALPAALSVPIAIELAPAEARLVDVSCPNGGEGRPVVTVEARPGLLAASIGEPRINASGSRTVDPATLLDTPLLKIAGRANTEVASQRFTSLRFDGTEIGNGAVKRVATSGMAASLAGSLVADLELRTSGLGAAAAEPVKTAIVALLSTSAPAIDGLVDGVLAALGIAVGEADIRVTAASCGHPVLVQ